MVPKDPLNPYGMFLSNLGMRETYHKDSVDL